ncbi:MAG: SpoIID/LytB domain-containing protein [Bacteroidales bacterium]|nr:SpoIID/LytB domain-containing protein [Bacteroidales bacterium]
MRLFLSTFFLQLAFLTAPHAQSIRISVFNSQEINYFTVNISEGRYVLRSNGETLGEYKKGIFYFSKQGNSIEVRDKRNLIGKFQEVELKPMEESGILKVNPVSPNLEGREYDGNLMVRMSGSRMKIINVLDLEKYVAAVIEAEGGNHAEPEFYKAQAVLIRTFTIKNLYKHAEEGFDLCDEVHCQAYLHRCTQNADILSATVSTAGKVLVDQDGVLIMSPFHSNCGGKTSASGMVWQKDLPYLKSVTDPFCSVGKQATWTASISREDWLKFLADYTKSPIDYSRYDFSFKPAQRARYISIHGIELNMRTVRETFGLKSAYFSIQDLDGKITFNGRGYGHGVGMCQEGAMEMARVNYSWLDIIHYYFKDVEVVDYREMELHRFKSGKE